MISQFIYFALNPFGIAPVPTSEPFDALGFKPQRPSVSKMPDYLLYQTTEPPAPTEDDSFLEDLLGRKAEIVAANLDALAVAMTVRVRLWAEQLDGIEEDRETAERALAQLDQQARYHLREQQDKTPFYRVLFSLEEERRTRAAECWRDLVLVLRDFLLAREVHQQSQARAMLLQDVGR
jgi:hypothetical protein